MTHAWRILTPAPVWRPPEKGRRICGRDPAAGPGTCWLWWEGCPKGAERGCYQIWAKSEAVLDHWLEQAPIDWAPPPDDLPAGTGGELRKRGQIEAREVDCAWQWRRSPAKAPP